MFFWSHPRCFGPLGKFQHNIKISIKTARVSRLSVSYDYAFIDISSRPEIFFKILQNQEETQSLLVQKVANRCFPVNFVKFLRTSFFYGTLPVVFFTACLLIRVFVQGALRKRQLLGSFVEDPKRRSRKILSCDFPV